jgi:hypothetical protein
MTKEFCSSVLKSVILPVVLLLSFLLLSSLPVHAAQYLSIGNYQLVSSKRINSTVWQYTYKAWVTNTAASDAIATGVTANIWLGGTKYVSLNFGDVPGGVTQSSTNTFTLTIDRRNPMPFSYFSSADISVTGWSCQTGALPALDTCHAYVFDTSLDACIKVNKNTAITLEPVVSPGGVPMVPSLTRYVHSPQPGITADLYYDDTCTVWNGKWVQSMEPHDNDCGPTAVLNLLSWYGITSDYPTLESEMETNNWESTHDLTGIKFGVCALGCTFVLVPDPTCMIPCMIGLEHLPEPGTLPDGMLNGLILNQPPGYMPQLSSNDPKNPDWFEQKLMAGTPVAILMSNGDFNLHWALVTGIYEDPTNGLTYKLANGEPLSPTGTMDSFYTDWSLDPVSGSGVVKSVLGDLGLQPYTALWYEKVTELRAKQALFNGDKLISQNGKYELSFWYGQLTLTNPFGTIIWQSSSTEPCTGQFDCSAYMQDDGNFVVFNAASLPSGHVIWATNTQGGSGSFLALQDDGNLVVYNAKDQKLWSRP